MSVTPARTALDDLDALLAKATPGPWSVDKDGDVIAAADPYSFLVTGVSEDDAALIVALRNEAPAMLAAIRAAYTLAEEMAESGQLPETHGEFDRGVAAHQRDAAARLRAALDEALEATGE